MPAFELILQFRGRRVETEEEVAEIEDVLVELLADGEALHGHEIGAAARNISIVTDDAHATFRRLEPFLARAQLTGELTAATAPLATQRYTLVWPRNGGTPFSRT
jgi:hypothetical protein